MVSPTLFKKKKDSKDSGKASKAVLHFKTILSTTLEHLWEKNL